MKKIVKLIMELIFIFILPLLFILLSIDVKKEDIYNADNLLESETKTFEYNNQLLIDIDDPYYINFLDFNQLIPNLNSNNWSNYNSSYTDIDYQNNELKITSLINGDGTSNWRFGIQLNDYINLDSNDKYFIKLNIYTSSVNSFRIELSNGNNLYVNSIPLNEWYTYTNFISGNYTTSRVLLYPNNSLNIDEYYIINSYELINLTQMFGSGYEPTTENELNNYININANYNYTSSEMIIYESNAIISSNYKVNYTPFGSLKKLVLDQFHLNDNFIVKVLFDYTVIWFVMFLLWHLFYGLFDGLIHMLSFDRKRE